MAITKVWIEEGCITCGNSEEVCPILEIDIDKGTAIVKDCDDYTQFEVEIKLAAASCPVSVIKYEEN